MPKKYRKLIAKGSLNDAKMDTKIDENSYFSEKGWNARNYLFHNRKRGSGHLKSHEKSMKNPCKIDARQRHAKSMDNYAKMEAKWRPKSLENLKICEKRHAENRCWILMLKKVRILSLTSDFWLIFGAVWGVWGVAEFKLRLQADFFSRFTRPAP